MASLSHVLFNIIPNLLCNFQNNVCSLKCRTTKVLRDHGAQHADQSSPSSRRVYVACGKRGRKPVMTSGNKCTASAVDSHESGRASNIATDCKDAKRPVKETVQRIKSITSHVGLLITLMLYTVIGGLVSAGERNNESTRIL